MGLSSFIPHLICIISFGGTTLANIHLGQEFLAVFLQNENGFKTKGVLNLTITAFRDRTAVQVKVTKTDFHLSMLLNKGESQNVQLPRRTELVGSGVFDSTILINSNKDISVILLNYKKESSSRIVVHPVDILGIEYYIITPNMEPKDNVKEFAVVNYRLPNTVTIFAKDNLEYKSRSYNAKHPLIVNLQPFEVLQLQSKKDLSGTKVLSEEPIAVFSGDSCSWLNSRCDHISEQLLPVSTWGKEYIVPPLPFQFKADVAYVTASQDTHLSFTYGLEHHKMELQAGKVIQFEIRFSRPLYISGNVPIQVIFYCTGGISQNLMFDPFLIVVPDVSQFCTTYQVHGMQGFQNELIITAQTSSIPKMIFNKISLDTINWNKIDGTEYSWAKYVYGQQMKSHYVQNSKAPFSVMNIGLSKQTSYGMSGVCVKNKPSKGK